jgi:hypothetical protein
MRSTHRTLAVSLALVAVGAGVAVAAGSDDLGVGEYAQVHDTRAAGAVAAVVPVPPPTPEADCGPGSLPETAAQGRVPKADYASGRAGQGYTCNAEQVGHTGTTGGFKTFEYRDTAGHRCAYYDGTLLFPTSAFHGDAPGVHVLDMTDPADPVETARLLTLGTQTPHESLVLNAERGLLAAVTGTPATAPAVVDVYDVSQDCRRPQLRSSLPLPGVLGHESGFSPDGRTLWVSSQGITALDVSDPTRPSPVWSSDAYSVHGLSLDDDGTRLYASDLSGETGVFVLDVSEVQERAPAPVVREVSRLDWPERSIPQNTIPVTFEGREHLIQFDEYARDVFAYDPASPVGAARIIDISDETRPVVVSTMRLQVNQPSARAGEQQDDPGAQQGVQGYAAHYCGVPTTTDPTVLACSFILSGLRVFDIADPQRPREVAYFNQPAPDGLPLLSGAYAMSAPSFDVERRLVYYADGNSGFYALRLTNGVWGSGAAPVQQPPATGPVQQPAARAGSGRTATPAPDRPASGSRLPATGPAGATLLPAVVLLLLAGLLRRRHS